MFELKSPLGSAAGVVKLQTTRQRSRASVYLLASCSGAASPAVRVDRSEQLIYL